jgi:hypothetical protein
MKLVVFISTNVLWREDNNRWEGAGRNGKFVINEKFFLLFSFDFMNWSRGGKGKRAN